ncbi:uncharacterized protein [Macrobrachium rosenbergii]|uniref:uncharacterized protein n=1 Tax=Macrobrachium rosenbergii TaxID=79674 RepID=UPI0034D64486
MGVMTKGKGGGSLRDVLLGGGRGGIGGGGGGGGPPGSSGGGTSRGGALTWRSLRSVSGTVDAVDPQGHFFPAKLALSLAILKLILAIFMISLGALALVLQAALSSLGAGLWAGAVVGVSGFLGVCASRRPYAHVYVVSFMCIAILSMASSGLLIILSATAWARDNQHPTAVFVEEETQEEVKVLGEVLVRRPAVLVSGALVLIGVLDCMVSLACATVSAREACGLYSKSEDRAQGLSEGHNRKERLYRWLGQQKTIFPIGSSQHNPRGGVSAVSQFVPLSSSESSSSATPRKTSSDPSGTFSNPLSVHHQTHHSSAIPSTATSQITQNPPSHIPSSAKSSRVTHESLPSILKPSSLPGAQSAHSLVPSTKYLPHSKHHEGQHLKQRPQPELSQYPSGFYHLQNTEKQQFHPHLQHPGLPQHLPPLQPYPPFPMYPQQAAVHQLYPTHTSHPSLFYPHLLTPMMPVQQDHPQQPRKHKSKHSESRKHKHKEEKKEKKSKKKKELTDEQIERSYTGLDREIAEEFIDSAMEPAVSIHRALNTSFEIDSF